jgi:hypothetical protein
MTTLQLIKEAIGALKDRTGSSVIAINKYIETEKKVRSVRFGFEKGAGAGFFDCGSTRFFFCEAAVVNRPERPSLWSRMEPKFAALER